MVFIDKRELKCAHISGGSNVRLGAQSLTENRIMIFMALETPARALGCI
ncbi:MAG: hypothetical protein HKO95_11830 [Rhodobacteraceae bacterium]|nr:hypothetical protein [Paracoccaceae bacterium]